MSEFHWSPKSCLLRYFPDTPRPAGTKAIVTLWVDACSELEKADFMDHSDPYVIIGVRGEDEELTHQEQRSRTQTNTGDPFYTPGERFEFAVKGNEKLILSVYDEDTITKDDLLAHGVLDVAKILSVTHANQPLLGKDIHLELFAPKGGHTLRSRCHLRVRWDTLEFAGGVREDVVIQYERYKLGNVFRNTKGSWSPEHLSWQNGSDRPPWRCFAADGNHKDASEFKDAIPDLPAGYTIIKDFYNQGARGWQYAPAFSKSNNNWRLTPSMTTFVRCRYWHRVSAVESLPYSCITTFDHGASFGIHDDDTVAFDNNEDK
mmetsp:Transcript_23475/g.30499  ORF Transcript_23475/g.30499 Transcript_23475/m.30499 type:complete len:318 (-) Transcript_23475:290-1243(-)